MTHESTARKWQWKDAGSRAAAKAETKEVRREGVAYRSQIPRKERRPMRPNPLMPTLTTISLPKDTLLTSILGGGCARYRVPVLQNQCTQCILRAAGSACSCTVGGLQCVLQVYALRTAAGADLASSAPQRLQPAGCALSSRGAGCVTLPACGRSKSCLGTCFSALFHVAGGLSSLCRARSLASCSNRSKQENARCSCTM